MHEARERREGVSGIKKGGGEESLRVMESKRARKGGEKREVRSEVR